MLLNKISSFFKALHKEKLISIPAQVQDKEKLTLTPVQEEILKFLSNDSPVVGVEAPTGTGKTATYLKFAEEWKGKVIISSFTKGLQTQIVNEIQKFFPHLSYTLLKGKKNYICQDKLSQFSDIEANLLNQTRPPLGILDKIKVTSKYCRKDYICDYRSSCEYMKTVERAKYSKIIIINHFLLESIVPRFSEGNLLLIIDECHELDKAVNGKKVFFPPELFVDGKLTPPQEPEIQNYHSKQEFNIAVEQFLTLKELYELAKSLDVTQAGEVTLPKKKLDFTASKIVYISATFPIDLFPEDFCRVKDTRSWENITFNIMNTNYKQSNYKKILFNTIRKCLAEYPKTLILSNSYETVDLISQNFHDVKTSRNSTTITELANNENVKAVASTSIWRGLNVPGRKAVIMTKLPFDPVGEHEDYPTAVAKMLQKFSQGCGRMKRSPQCEGEIFILDNRVVNYPELLEYLNNKKQNGAVVVFENDFHTQNVGRNSSDKVIQLDKQKKVATERG